jgi:pectate lyase
MAGAILLAQALAGCDVRIRPITFQTMPDASATFCAADQMVGFATLPYGSVTTTTTGGGTTAPVLVDAADPDPVTEFKTYADRKTGAAVIQIKGMLSFAGFSDSQVRVASNTTVIGVDAHSGFTGGGLDLAGNSNIIIKNLVISKAAGTDAITIQGPGSSNIWVDHCDLSSELHPDGASYDGLVDITHAAEMVTVSWTVFHDHKDTGIIGHSDTNMTEDTGHLHVTYDHDMFQNVDAGPRVRFGTVHVLNSFFDQVTYYGVAATMSASLLVENNYFQAVTAPGQPADYAPITAMLPESPDPGSVDESLNYNDPADPPYAIMGHTSMWTPPYSYKPDSSPGAARTVVQACAGPQ